MIYWLQITSGRGPEECCWVVSRLVKYFEKIASQKQLHIQLVDATPCKPRGTLSSALLAVQADSDINRFLKTWEGTVQWIGTSMYRPHHKRKNWFVSIKVLSPVAEENWNNNEIKIERMRSSGAGGQHVNKTESAIRVTHLPTGISAISREERSQHLNKQLAMLRLEQRLEKHREQILKEFDTTCWNNHNQLQRGNPCHVFSGKKFIYLR
jgi:peptide chain release factor